MKEPLSEERKGRNNATFREANERIRAAAEEQDFPGRVPFICECATPTCIEQIELEPAEYERLRSDPTLFAIKPGHEVSNVEEIIERSDRFWVVRKSPGEPAERARRLASDRD